MADEKTLETGVDTEAVRYESVEEDVPAQVAPPRDPEPDTVPINEVRVATDVVITDPSSPLAVQTEGGSGSTDLPIHRLASPSPEQVLAGAEPAEEQPSYEDPEGPVQAADDDNS